MPKLTGLAVYADGSREERVAEAADTTEDIEKGDSFGGHSDSQPNGPASVGLDFAFPFANNVYGIPEHTSPLSLPATSFGPGGQAKYNDPYRLYNLDVFEYELDTTMALYGHIPLMLAHGLVQNKGVTAVSINAHDNDLITNILFTMFLVGYFLV